MGIVYHYANTQAFKGVVENAEVWATDFRYLNDSRELVYTWAVFAKRLEQIAKQPSDHSQAYRAQLAALKLLDGGQIPFATCWGSGVPALFGGVVAGRAMLWSKA